MWSIESFFWMVRFCPECWNTPFAVAILDRAVIAAFKGSLWSLLKVPMQGSILILPLICSKLPGADCKWSMPPCVPHSWMYSTSLCQRFLSCTSPWRPVCTTGLWHQWGERNRPFLWLYVALSIYSVEDCLLVSPEKALLCPIWIYPEIFHGQFRWAFGSLTVNLGFQQKAYLVPLGADVIFHISNFVHHNFDVLVIRNVHGIILIFELLG